MRVESKRARVMRGPFLRQRAVSAAERIEADVLEDVAQIAQLLAAGRRGLRHEVEHFAVLQTVIGKPRNPAVLVEIDRDHPLVHDLIGHEGRRALRLLRNVIKRFAAHGGDGGGGAEHDQHLLLRRADRNLLERAFLQHIAALQRLGVLPQPASAKPHASASAGNSRAAFLQLRIFLAPGRSFRSCIGVRCIPAGSPLT